MSRWLDIARKAKEYDGSYPGTQQEPSKRGGEQQERSFLLVSNGCRVEGESQGQASTFPQSTAVHPSSNPVTAPNIPHCTTDSGRPVTWTGKVVSLDEWRDLSEWERHGPNGTVWNGKTQKWEQMT